jgi:hypothetical protein
MRGIISKNPFTGKVRETVNFISNNDLDAKLDRSEKAF